MKGCLVSDWPAITTEEVPWHLRDEDVYLIPKSRRRKITSTYQAAVPAKIRHARPRLSAELTERLADARMRLVRFDEHQDSLPFNLPSLLLRSESAASSQIENLTSSARNIALAELSSSAPPNALVIAGNIDAMRCALNLEDALTTDGIRQIHRQLLKKTALDFAGELRGEQVWVGGTPYSPHGALFVPPVPGRVDECLDDLCAFTQTEGIDPIAKAALVHAQFETIHPFVDGNGRTGRTLLHRMLRSDGVLLHATVPISAGLLHDIDDYMSALSCYQQGDPAPIVEQVCNAIDLAMVVGQKTSRTIAGLVGDWTARMQERSGSRIFGLPALLVEQPVVNSDYVANGLEITRRSATSTINRACEYGILKPLGNMRRGDFYQAPELISILDEISSMAGIRRLVAGA